MLDCVGEKGFTGTTVGDVVASARVSRTAFYRLFEDKEECFIVACNSARGELLSELYEMQAQPSWVDAVRHGTEVYLRFWQDRPGLATAFLIELSGAGRRALEDRDHVYERFAEMFEGLGRRARAEEKGLPPLPALAPRLIVAAIIELLAQELRAGRGGKLTAMQDELVFFILKTLADDRTARRAVGSG
jgi:AcrR family transcriptional regulator